MTNKEKQAAIKEKRVELLSAIDKENPNYKSGRKKVMHCVFVLVGLRFLLMVLEIIFSLINNIPISPIMFVGSMIPLLFLWLLFMGIKGAAYLALLGGAHSIFMAVDNQIFLLFNTFDTFFNVINVVLHISILIQIIGIMYILLDKQSKSYFDSMKVVQGEMTTFIKENNMMK